MAILDSGLLIIRGTSHKLILVAVYAVLFEPLMKNPLIWILSFASLRVQKAFQGVHGIYTLLYTRAALVLTKPLPWMDNFSFTVPCPTEVAGLAVIPHRNIDQELQCLQVPLLWHALLLILAVSAYFYLVRQVISAFNQWRFNLKYSKVIPSPVAATEMKSNGKEVSANNPYYVALLNQPKHVVQLVQVLDDNVSRILGMATVVTVDGHRVLITAKHVTDSVGLCFKKNKFDVPIVVKSNLVS